MRENQGVKIGKKDEKRGKMNEGKKKGKREDMMGEREEPKPMLHFMILHTL